MSVKEIISYAKITEDIWKNALESHNIVPDEYDRIPFYRVTKKVENLKKGCIITEENIIFNFPRIARILQLENGIKKAFTKPFYVEEKVDGYNVRVAKVQDQALAFTRGGYVCPFSTDRLPDFFNVDKFFDENPNLIICGEIAGPENPYNIEYPPYVTKDVNFFAFDIRIKNTDKQTPTEKKYELFDKYEIPTVTHFGKHKPSDIKKLTELIEDLNERGCEGLVFKPTSMSERMLKYVTIGSCLRDMKVTSSVMIETPPEFFIHRIIRSVFSLLEHNQPLDKKFLENTGGALIPPLFESINKATKGEMIVERFNIRFINERNINKLFEHFHKCKVDAELINKKKVGRYWHVEFVRRSFPSYEIVRKHWEGNSHFD